MSGKRSFIWLGGRDGASAVVSEFIELQLDAGKPLLLLVPDRSRRARRWAWYHALVAAIGRGVAGTSRAHSR